MLREGHPGAVEAQQQGAPMQAQGMHTAHQQQQQLQLQTQAEPVPEDLPEYGFEPGFPHSLRGFQGYAKRFATLYFGEEPGPSRPQPRDSPTGTLAPSGPGTGTPAVNAVNGVTNRGIEAVVNAGFNGGANGVKAEPVSLSQKRKFEGVVSGAAQAAGTTQPAGASAGAGDRARPSWDDVEGEYWRIVENPTERIEVRHVLEWCAIPPCRCLPLAPTWESPFPSSARMPPSTWLPFHTQQQERRK